MRTPHSTPIVAKPWRTWDGRGPTRAASHPGATGRGEPSRAMHGRVAAIRNTYTRAAIHELTTD